MWSHMNWQQHKFNLLQNVLVFDEKRKKNFKNIIWELEYWNFFIFFQTQLLCSFVILYIFFLIFCSIFTQLILRSSTYWISFLKIIKTNNAFIIWIIEYIIFIYSYSFMKWYILYTLYTNIYITYRRISFWKKSLIKLLIDPEQ